MKFPRNPDFSSRLPPVPPECTQPPKHVPLPGHVCVCRPVEWPRGDLLGLHPSQPKAWRSEAAHSF